MYYIVLYWSKLQHTKVILKKFGDALRQILIRKLSSSKDGTIWAARGSNS